MSGALARPRPAAAAKGWWGDGGGPRRVSTDPLSQTLCPQQLTPNSTLIRILHGNHRVSSMRSSRCEQDRRESGATLRKSLLLMRLQPAAQYDVLCATPTRSITEVINDDVHSA